MTDQQQNKFAQNGDELDRAIDAALAKYMSVEPRAGLEQRILANLNAQPRDAEKRVWWRLGLAAAMAFALLAAGLVWKSARSRPSITNGSPKVDAGQKAPRQRNASSVPEPLPTNEPSSVRRVRHTQPRVGGNAGTLQAAVPKREQFPSPQPLSEQEKLLASYVADDPHHAVLIARAQADLEKQDHEEEMREMNANQDSKQIQQ